MARVFKETLCHIGLGALGGSRLYVYDRALSRARAERASRRLALPVTAAFDRERAGWLGHTRAGVGWASGDQALAMVAGRC